MRIEGPVAFESCDDAGRLSFDKKSNGITPLTAPIPGGVFLRCYNAAMQFSDEQIMGKLTATGQEIGRYFLCGESILYRAASGQLSARLIEDDDHARATREHLTRIGAEVVDELPPAPAAAVFPLT